MSRVEKLEQSFSSSLQMESKEEQQSFKKEELDSAIERSQNSFEIIQMLSKSVDFLSLKSLVQGLTKVAYFQKHLEELKSNQLAEFKNLSQVRSHKFVNSSLFLDLLQLGLIIED